MPESTRKLGDDELSLQNRDEIQAAYDAVAITGSCPEAESLLGPMLDLLPPTSAPPERQAAFIHLQGGDTELIKKGILVGLEIIIDNSPLDSDGRQAAQGLLHILQER